MKVKDICEGYEELGLNGDEDIVCVVESDNGSGDEWDVLENGNHLGCLYDDGDGYKFSPAAFAGDDYC